VEDGKCLAQVVNSHLLMTICSFDPEREMKVGDLVKDEFGSVGICTERKDDHVFVQFPTWSGWSLAWLFEVCRENS